MHRHTQHKASCGNGCSWYGARHKQISTTFALFNCIRWLFDGICFAYETMNNEHSYQQTIRKSTSKTRIRMMMFGATVAFCDFNNWRQFFLVGSGKLVGFIYIENIVNIVMSSNDFDDARFLWHFLGRRVYFSALYFNETQINTWKSTCSTVLWIDWLLCIWKPFFLCPEHDSSSVGCHFDEV